MALTLGLMAPTVLHAQSDATPADLDDGLYFGSISFTGGFIIDMAQAIAETGQSTGGADISGQLILDSAINGPASMTVTDGAVTGEWTIAGTSTTDGRFTGTFNGVTASLSIDGAGVYDGAGTFTGSPKAATMIGTLNTTNTATASANGLEQTATSSDSQELMLTLTEPLGDCGRAFARVDLDLRQAIDQLPGTTATVIGVFTGDVSDEGYDFTVLESINAGISGLWNGLDAADDPLFLLSEAFDLLREIEAAEDQLTGLDCGQDVDFANAMTLLGAELVRAIIDLATSSDFSDSMQLWLIDQALELGLRTGSLGQGRGDRGGARQIAERARAEVERIFSDAEDLDDSVAAALLAKQYGWVLTNDAGVTSDDVLLVVGK